MPGLHGTAVTATRSSAPAEVLAAHRGAGRFFHAAGVRSFVRERGTGPAVVCIHGMIGSSFLYRKVLDELAGHGLRGVAFDLPGLGLADRPARYDYSWTGLGRFCAAAVDELGIDRFHLVVHDIGGPVGFELATAMPHRILSLTMLNTTVDVTEFSSPWSTRPFRFRGIGDPSSVSTAELDTYLALMKGPDRGRAFLQIMRSTERTPAKQARYRAAVGNVPYPVQAIWGVDDPAMTLAVYGEKARAAAGLAEVVTVAGKHFPQEDQAPAIAYKIAAQALRLAPPHPLPRRSSS